jgi:hypothetical protein
MLDQYLGEYCVYTDVEVFFAILMGHQLPIHGFVNHLY